MVVSWNLDHLNFEHAAEALNFVSHSYGLRIIVLLQEVQTWPANPDSVVGWGVRHKAGCPTAIAWPTTMGSNARSTVVCAGTATAVVFSGLGVVCAYFADSSKSFSDFENSINDEASHVEHAIIVPLGRSPIDVARLHPTL